VRDHRPPHHRPHLQLRRPHLPPSPTTWTRSLTAQSLLRRYWRRQYTLPIVVRIDRVSICSPILNFMCCPLHPRSAVLPSSSYDLKKKTPPAIRRSRAVRDRRRHWDTRARSLSLSLSFHLSRRPRSGSSFVIPPRGGAHLHHVRLCARSTRPVLIRTPTPACA
jgi:hypothetical protein